MNTTLFARLRTLAPWIVLAIIVAWGATLRMAQLGSNPPGLWQDEASTGVDAWLIWTTGRDRAGAFLPVIARSFGDYPLALYRYLAAPIVGLFGLTVTHERLVAALAGTLMLLSTGWLARINLGNRAAFWVVLSGAFTPTWIHFSRYGSEAILLPATLITGVALFEHGRVHRRAWPLWVGTVVLAASAYTYHAVKVLLPLLLLAFAWYERPFALELWRSRRRVLVGLLALFILGVLPSAIFALTPEGMARGRTVAAWNFVGGFEVARTILNNYLSYFDPGFLFTRGGPAVAQSVPGIGLWCFLDLPAIVIALLAIARGQEPQRFLRFVLLWFLLGPLPGGLTFETHNVGRMIGSLPAPQLLAGYGVAQCWSWAHTRWQALGLGAITGAAWLATALYTTHLVMVRYPFASERDWQFEISRALECAKAQRKNRQIVVAPQFQAAEVFALFHLSELPPLPGGKPPWVFGNRQWLSPGEIYAAPVTERRPEGSPLCEIRQRNTGELKAFVVRSNREDEGPKLRRGFFPVASATTSRSLFE